MAGSGNRADPRREQLAFGKWFQSARFHIGLQRSAIALEHRLEEFGGLAFVLGVEPVVEVFLVDPYDRIGKRGLSLRSNATDVICMKVRQIDIVDLLRPVSGCSKVLQQVTAACAIETAGAAVDQNELLSCVHQEGVDRALHGSGEIGGCEQRICFAGMAFRELHDFPLSARHRLVPRHHFVDRERMRAVEQSCYLHVTKHHAVEARRLRADLRSSGMRLLMRQQRYERQERDDVDRLHFRLLIFRCLAQLLASQPFQPFRKSRRSLLTASGCSSCGRWPQLSIGATERFSAISLQTAFMSKRRPTAPKSSPQSESTGHLTFCSASSRSCAMSSALAR